MPPQDKGIHDVPDASHRRMQMVGWAIHLALDMGASAPPSDAVRVPRTRWEDTSMSKHTGHVIWRELMTLDLAATERFYGGAFGWTFEAMPVPGGTYTIVKCGSGPGIAGIMQMSKEMMQGPPAWISYVSVPDVDASCAAAKSAGAMIVHGPVSMDGVGRMATLLDADRACFAVMTPQGPDEAPGRPPMHGFCWETLSTSDLGKAKTFYEAVCGWKQASSPSGFAVMEAPDGAQICDVQRADKMPPMWMTYVVVESVETSSAKVAELGGKVMVPRFDIPKVGAIGVVCDPLGAMFGLFVPDMA